MQFWEGDAKVVKCSSEISTYNKPRSWQNYIGTSHWLVTRTPSGCPCCLVSAECVSIIRKESIKYFKTFCSEEFLWTFCLANRFCIQFAMKMSSVKYLSREVVFLIESGGCCFFLINYIVQECTTPTDFSSQVTDKNKTKHKIRIVSAELFMWELHDTLTWNLSAFKTKQQTP